MDGVDGSDDGFAAEGIVDGQDLDGPQVDVEVARSPGQLGLLLQADDLMSERGADEDAVAVDTYALGAGRTAGQPVRRIARDQRWRKPAGGASIDRRASCRRGRRAGARG